MKLVAALIDQHVEIVPNQFSREKSLMTKQPDAQTTLAEEQKHDRDMLLFGTGVMLDGKHVPIQKITTPFRIFKDGNAWCAVGPHFKDIMQSECGFGDTPRAAYDAYIEEISKSAWWIKQPDFPPKFSEFAWGPDD